MKKYWQKTQNTIPHPHHAHHHILRIFLRCILFVCSLFCGIVLLSWCFGISLVTCNPTQKLSSTYYAIYALPDGQAYNSAYDFSEHLKLRGAGGNIIEYNSNYIVVLSIYKDIDEVNRVIDNLSKQNIECKNQAIILNENISKLSQDEQQVLYKLYNLNISCINRLIEIINNLEQNNITQMDAYVDIFSLFTQYQNTLNNLTKSQNERLTSYIQKTIKVQSLLYLLTQENHHSATQTNYISIVRNFAYRIVDILK